ncbi:uncharacterized protein Tco025E_00145 [Trypanosoma conorhini]|uniref:Thioredoxin domain-containing protein n=1 Tax=Trypanosoma conorhini TaxID=83891 RepID=A0A3R7PZX1_9TRYP|nr:uncharacterized protein Tco025E_00145 [Trypanosoma conorhini]RNF27584.1 hypothetical protein Tco025E_00145 [Trypanosoma conorhini]
MTSAAASHEVSDARSDDAWPEFTQSMCEELNGKRCLALAAATAPAKLAAVCRCIDDACARLVAASSAGAKEEKPLKPNDLLLSLQRAPRVCFTTEAGIAKLQKCTAVYGRTPSLLLLEMYDDRAFVLDLNPGLLGNSEQAAAVEAFLRGVAEGSVAKALQGAAPPDDDRLEPTHGITLSHGLCAVTSTFRRLKRKEAGGAVCVFWSSRCAVCPAVLMMMDHLVGVVWKASEACGVARPFSYLACNIDDNDLPAEDWPETPHQQTVPTTAAYDGNGERFVYTGKRSAAPIVRFICAHCLPRDLPTAARITSDALAIAEKLTDEELWEIGLPPAANKDVEKKSPPHGGGNAHEASVESSRGARRKRPLGCSETLPDDELPQRAAEQLETQKRRVEKEHEEVMGP